MKAKNMEMPDLNIIQAVTDHSGRDGNLKTYI